MENVSYVSRAGAVVQLQVIGEGLVPNHDARYVRFRVTTETGETGSLEVRFPQPPIIAHSTRQELGVEFDGDLARKLGVVAALEEIDLNPDPIIAGHVVVFNADAVEALSRRPRLSDKDIRRYLARLLHAAYQEETLSVQVTLDDLDYLITGASEKDMIRNGQVLEGDELVRLHLTMGPKLHSMQPTARLVREMERWGGPREDLATPDQYEARLRGYPGLAGRAEALLAERARYIVASSIAELESVFRATAPIIEGLARDLLVACGSMRDLSTLGPIIAEIQSRGIGGMALLSQLNHVLKFGRDLAEHGHAVSEPVLRIACENAFELAPQLASLFPRGAQEPNQ